jgi:hypothetical protein
MNRILTGAIILTALACLPAAAQAQNPYSNLSGGITSGPVSSRPTVSPYLNLLRPQGGVAIPNYQALVRPMLEQERINQNQGRQLAQMNRMYQGPSSQSSAGAPIEIRGTGHKTGFMNYSAYYPSLQNAQQARRPGMTR